MLQVSASQVHQNDGRYGVVHRGKGRSCDVITTVYAENMARYATVLPRFNTASYTAVFARIVCGEVYAPFTKITVIVYGPDFEEFTAIDTTFFYCLILILTRCLYGPEV